MGTSATDGDDTSQWWWHCLLMVATPPTDCDNAIHWFWRHHLLMVTAHTDGDDTFHWLGWLNNLPELGNYWAYSVLGLTSERFSFDVNQNRTHNLLVTSRTLYHKATRLTIPLMVMTTHTDSDNTSHWWWWQLILIAALATWDNSLHSLKRHRLTVYSRFYWLQMRTLT